MWDLSQRLVSWRTAFVVPRPSFIPDGNLGAEHIGPDDTIAADYGRLPGRVPFEGSEWRARRDSNPRPTGSKPAALSN